MSDPQSLIDAATRAGLSPELAAVIPRIVHIESGGNPNAVTGSYTGILQMGPQERRQYGGDSLQSGLNLLRDRASQFEQKFGRPPTPTEFYLTHQQGLGGLSAHVGNPDAPAWQNMASTAEGQQKGAGWARQAIWGNIPTPMRAQFPGGVGDVTSRQFMDLWRQKVEGGPQMAASASSGAGAPPVAPAAAAQPASLRAGAAGFGGPAPEASPTPGIGAGMLSGADLSGKGPDIGELAQRAMTMMAPQQQQVAPMKPLPIAMPKGLSPEVLARLQMAALGRG